MHLLFDFDVTLFNTFYFVVTRIF